MTRPSIKLSLEKDIAILMFLWRWKVATTAMLGLRFYGSDQSAGIYQRLCRLEKASFVQSRCAFTGKHFVWTLTVRGFQAIEGRLGKLAESGFKSENIGHDLLVNAIHLGDWITKIPDGCEFYTEQEMRRMATEDYPDWVPQTSRHRPDGYWKVSSGDKPRVLALEVELCRKSDRDYFAIADFYQAWKRIYRVVWVVEKPKDARALTAKFKSVVENDGDYHNFVLLNQVVDHGWQAKVIHGKDQGSRLAELLDDPSIIRPSSIMGKFLMNAAKSPHSMKGYQVFSPSDFRN